MKFFAMSVALSVISLALPVGAAFAVLLVSVLLILKGATAELRFATGWRRIALATSVLFVTLVFVVVVVGG